MSYTCRDDKAGVTYVYDRDGNIVAVLQDKK